MLMNSMCLWYGLLHVRKGVVLLKAQSQVHVQRIFHTYSKPNIATEARKLMHRFDEGQVEKLIDEAEGHS